MAIPTPLTTPFTVETSQLQTWQLCFGVSIVAHDHAYFVGNRRQTECAISSRLVAIRTPRVDPISKIDMRKFTPSSIRSTNSALALVVLLLPLVNLHAQQLL